MNDVIKVLEDNIEEMENDKQHLLGEYDKQKEKL